MTGRVARHREGGRKGSDRRGRMGAAGRGRETDPMGAAGRAKRVPPERPTEADKTGADLNMRSAPVFDRCRPCVPAGEYPVRRPDSPPDCGCKTGATISATAQRSGSHGNHSARSFGSRPPGIAQRATRNAAPSGSSSTQRPRAAPTAPALRSPPAAPAQRRMMRLLSSASGSGAGTKSE